MASPGRDARNAFITGGSGGIGKACGRELVERGYDVILTARREAPLREAAAEHRRAVGGRRRVGSRRVRARRWPTSPGVDLFVHAAGILGGTYARKQTFEQWRTTMSANLDSCFVVTSGSPAEDGGRALASSSSRRLPPTSRCRAAPHTRRRRQA